MSREEFNDNGKAVYNAIVYTSCGGHTAPWLYKNLDIPASDIDTAIVSLSREGIICGSKYKSSEGGGFPDYAKTWVSSGYIYAVKD